MTNNIEIQFVKMSISESLENYILKKIEKVINHYKNLTTINIYIKKENTSDDTGKICEIEIRQPHLVFFASSNENNYQQAVKNSVKNIRRQLDKH